MIVWLASWPRSGNTLLRQIIQQCLGIQTYSKYGEPELEWLLGEEANSLGRQWSREFHQELKESKERYLIKTHDLSAEDSSGIYVIRDGRDAHASLSRYWKCSVEELIRGDLGEPATERIGDWSEHWNFWQPHIKQSGLLLRFEDMVKSPDVIAMFVAGFLNHTSPLREYISKFPEWHLRLPKMFDKGKVGSWKEVFTKEDEELFWKLHGDTMRYFGYK